MVRHGCFRFFFDCVLSLIDVQLAHTLLLVLSGVFLDRLTKTLIALTKTDLTLQAGFRLNPIKKFTVESSRRFWEVSSYLLHAFLGDEV